MSCAPPSGGAISSQLADKSALLRAAGQPLGPSDRFRGAENGEVGNVGMILVAAAKGRLPVAPYGAVAK
ncbi:MAG: hypothetical protein HKM91_01710 [Altererythrobacter sp.]|nr:hypothetical protein [Altererythrobacter sp.]